MKEELNPLIHRIEINTNLVKQSQDGIRDIIAGFQAFSKLEWK